MEDGGALGARAEEEPKKKRGQRGRKAPQRSFCRRDPPNDDRERGGLFSTSTVRSRAVTLADPDLTVLDAWLAKDRRAGRQGAAGGGRANRNTRGGGKGTSAREDEGSMGRD
jgi:hypothetical protein